MHVRIAQLEDRDDLQDVFDVHAVRTPCTLWIAGGPRGVDHRSAEGSRLRFVRLLLGRCGHQPLIGEPALRCASAQGDEAAISCNLVARCIYCIDVLRADDHDACAGVVKYVSDL
jgi:hypothetical protein